MKQSETFVQGRRRWAGRQVGGRLMIAFGTTLMRYTGWRPIYLIALIGTACYWWWQEQIRKESVRYWRYLRPQSSLLDQSLWAYRHMLRWAHVSMDRQLFYQDSFSYSGSGLEHLQRCLAEKKGCILLSAHVGNWELSAARLNGLSDQRTAIVRILEDSPQTRGLIAAHMADRLPEVIDPRDAMGASLRIRSALNEGRLVCMLGDRQLDGQGGIRVPFLSRPATFSSGPFLVAGLTGAPIIMGFFMKCGRRHFHIHMDPPWTISLPRKGEQRRQALSRAVQAWAQRLESIVRRYPTQWYNFFNFWE